MSDTPLHAADVLAGPEDGRAMPVSVNGPLPGATLVAAREAHGLTVEQVASQLNLAPRQVVALETDNYAALPGMVIARGFLRSYAKLLRIDPVPLLEVLSKHNQPSSTAPLRHTLSGSFSESSLPTPAATRAGSKSGPVVAGVVLLLAVAAVTFAMDWWPQPLLEKFGQWKQSAMSARTPVAEVETPAGTDGSISDLPQPAAGLSGGVDTGGLTTSTTLSVVPSGTASATGATPPAVADTAAEGGNSLQLTMQQDSWIEIRRADNTSVVSRLFKAGSVEKFDVAEPVTLIVGNAAGVKASLRGVPLELGGAGSGNVARLKLK